MNIAAVRTKTEKLLCTIELLLPSCLETMHVKLYGRSHSDPKTLRRWSTLRVMGPVGVKGGRGSKVPRKVHGSKAFKMSKLSKSFKGSRTLGVKG